MPKNSPIIKDWILVGFLSGVAASATKSVTNYLLFRAGVPTTLYHNLAGAMLLSRRKPLGFIPIRPLSTYEHVLDYTADTIIGGLFGSALSYVIAKTAPGNEMLKGAIGGATLWTTTFFFTGNLLKLAPMTAPNAKNMTTLLGTSILYGAIQGAFLGRYHSSAIEQVPSSTCESGQR